MGNFLIIPLFLSLFAFFILIFVPLNKYEATPADATVEAIRGKLENIFTSGDKGEKLSIINKSKEEVMRLAVIVGAGTGLLVFITAYILLRQISVLAVSISLIFIVIGIYITQLVIENEFKSWQEELVLGLKPFTGFFPVYAHLGVLTRAECIKYTLEFVSEPLKTELEKVLEYYGRTGKIERALDNLAQRSKHPLVDAVCFRLKITWNNKVEPDIFDDLSEELRNEKEKASGRKTLMKTALLSGIAMLALLGIVPVGGYVAYRIFIEQVTRGFGV